MSILSIIGFVNQGFEKNDVDWWWDDIFRASPDLIANCM